MKFVKASFSIFGDEFGPEYFSVPDEVCEGMITDAVRDWAESNCEAYLPDTMDIEDFDENTEIEVWDSLESTIQDAYDSIEIEWEFISEEEMSDSSEGGFDFIQPILAH